MATPSDTADQSSTLRTAFTGAYLLPTIILMLSIGNHATNVFVFSTVMPSAVADIGGQAYYSWATTFFIMASIIGAATAPLVKATQGPRSAYVTAASVFGAGSLGCALAPDMAWMIAARVVQGAGGGLMVSLGFAVIAGLFPRSLWAKVLTLVSGVWGIAALLGPVAGGLFAQAGFWRGAFWSLTLITAGLLIMALIAFPRRDSTGAGRIPATPPFGRLSLLAASVLATSVSGTSATNFGAAALLATGMAGLVVTLLIDRRSNVPLLPVQAFTFGHPIGLGLWMIFLIAAAVSPVGVFIPLFVQVLHDVSPAYAGYFHAVQALAWTGAALMVASLTSRAIRRALIAGPAAVATGLALLAVSLPGPSLVPVAVALLIAGGGVGLCWAHVSTTIMGAATDENRDRSSSAVHTVQLLGLAFGSALAGVVVNLAGARTSLQPDVIGTAAWVLFLLFAFSGVFAAIAGTALGKYR
ncbi:MFS transporter [Fodinicurvata sp. EGI_FJ10296]|uniref:MFS transporter n=1 Tax=Fodinicurvata sp. EGI_FJ10296 TaxID=3231908 RepID=UPI0034552106